MEREVGDPGGRGVQRGRAMASGAAVVSQSAVANVAPCDDGRGARDLRAGGFDGSVLALGRVTVVCHFSLRLGVTIPHQGRSGSLPHELPLTRPTLVRIGPHAGVWNDRCVRYFLVR